MSVVSSTFVARFESFYDEVSKASAKLSDLNMDGEKVQASLNRIGKAYSGDKLIMDATLTAKAIEDIGGAAILTDKEAAKVNRTMTEAIEKMTRLGVDVPPKMRQLAEDTGKVATASAHAGEKSGFMSESLARLAAAFSISTLIERAAGKLYEWAAASFEAAGKLTDLNGKTGVSLELLQRFQYVAAETGTSVDTFAGAAFMLSKNLDVSSNSLKRLGLEYANIKDMSPDQQFMAVLGALEKVTNESDRNRIGADLFGKKWQDIAPAVKDGFLKMAGAAKILGDEQIRALDAAGDRWEKFKLDTGKAITGYVGNLLIARDTMTSLSDVEKQRLIALMKAGEDANAILLKIANDRAASTAQSVVQTEKSTKSERDYRAELDEVVKSLSGLSPTTIKQIEAAKKLGIQNDELVSTFKLSETALRVLEEQTRKQEEADKKAAEAKKKHADALQNLADKYASSGLKEQEELLVEFLSKGVDVARMSSEAQKALAKDVADLMSHYKNLGQSAPAAVQAVYDATLALVTVPEVVKKAMQRANDEARKLQDDMLKQSIKNGIEQTNAALKNNKNALDSAVDVTRQMADLFSTPYERAVLKADEWAQEQIKAIAPLKRSMPEVFQKAKEAIFVIHEQMIADAQAAAKKTAGFWSKTFSELPASILDAVKGGGNVGETVGTVLANDLFADGGPMNKMLTNGANKLGNLIGGNLGANLANGMINMIPSIGAMIGPALGQMLNKISGAVAGWFGAVSKEVKEARGNINDLEASLAASLTAAQKVEAGGVGWKMTTIAVRDAYLSVGRTAAEAEAIVKQLWNDKDPKASKAAIEEINKVLAESKEKYKAITEEIKTLEAEMETLRAQSNPTFKDMEDAANKFGVNLASLGPKFQQSKINDQAKEIIDGFETLKRGGADVNAVLNGMADEISKVVNDSIKFKTTIPENMRPMIESLIQNGQLIDENGEKITDMSNIKFGEPIADKFTVIADRMKEVSDMLKDLIEKLGNGFKNAAEQAKAAADANLGNLSYDVPVTIHYNHDNETGSEGTDARGYASGTKGMTGAWFKNFGVGTRTVLHGDEAVVRRDQAGDFAAAFGAGGDSGTVAELRALRSDMAAMPTHIARAVRDAVLVAG